MQSKRVLTLRRICVGLLIVFKSHLCHSFSLDPRSSENGAEVTRRDLLYWPVGIVGAVVYGKLVADSVGKLSRGDLVFPEAHERSVKDTLAMATIAALNGETKGRPLRVLEVGMGKDCRLIRRGLYEDAIIQLSKEGVPSVSIYGVDTSIPTDSVRDDALRRLQRTAKDVGMEASLEIVKGSITQPLEFPAGYFDVVICSLTLCSVDDQDAAINVIKGLVRKDGGTFGYVEHVAVSSDEPYRLLALQQEVFDPLQQAVADNCHLHRSTDNNIARIFDTKSPNPPSAFISRERFLVDGMWPVSCQASGVIQLKG